MLLWWTQRDNCGHTLHRDLQTKYPSLSAPHTLQGLFVLDLGVKYFLIKHLVIKSWLLAWFVWLMSRFREWDWLRLLITVCAHEPPLGYCLTEAQMETANLYLQLPSWCENPNRKTELLLLYLSAPTHRWISAASWSSQPTAVSLCDALHISVVVY